MGNRKSSPNAANARFIELGSEGQPFRSVINVDHLTNMRYEQAIEEREVPVPGSEAHDAVFDPDTGEMLSPPQMAETQTIRTLIGWRIILLFGEQGQTIMFTSEEDSVNAYNSILDMMGGTGVPVARRSKLRVQPQQAEPSSLLGPDGKPFVPVFEDEELPGEVPDLTDEELDLLENPEIDIDAIADAIDDGLGAEDPDDGRG